MVRSFICAVLVATCVFAQERRPLFNGTDLDGWQFVGRFPGAKGFTVRDGVLETSGDKGMLWFTRAKFGNTKLHVVYKMSNEKGNSGIFIRIPVEPRSEGDAIHKGIEVQIDDRDNDWHSTGTLYSMTQAKARPSKKPGEWNHMVITMDGLRTMVHVNDVLVTDYDGVSPVPERKQSYEPQRGRRPEYGYIGIQNHDPSAVISFKEISIEPVPGKRSSMPGPTSMADAAFNGRWNINVEGGNRVWWLKITGAGTEDVKGEFVGAPGGGLDPIPELFIHNGEMQFAFRRMYGRRGPFTSSQAIYKARVVDGKLQGTFQIAGDDKVTNWTGVPAPELSAKASPADWRDGETVQLFNGRDLSGWRTVNAARGNKWTVSDGVLRNAPGTSDITTDQKFWNFKLHVEYRLGEHSNAGIGLRGRYEVQILDDYGKPAYNKGHGSIYSRIAPTQNASKPAGEWQSMDVTLIERRVWVTLNGVEIIKDQEIEGFTAIATDADEASPGPIQIQGDHGSVEYRKIVLTPLVRAGS